ncbi:MAG: hypothetical protein AAF441_26775 [Pseudomonadota bacterium]
MVSRTSQASRLLQLKTLRTDASKARMMKAAALLELARQREQHALAVLRDVRAHAAERRTERLQAIFDSEREHGNLQALAVAAWVKTDEEIALASGDVVHSARARQAGEQSLLLAQQELARTMRAQQKAEELLSLETKRERHAQSRQG